MTSLNKSVVQYEYVRYVQKPIGIYFSCFVETDIKKGFGLFLCILAFSTAH